MASPTRDAMPGPGQFNGGISDNGQSWLAKFELWSQYKGVNNQRKLAAMPLLLQQNAATWFQILPADRKDTFDNLRAAFVERYGQNQLAPWQRATRVWCMEQRPTEPVQDFVASIVQAANEAGLTDEQRLQAVIKGLRPSIRQYVLRQQPANIEELLAAAILAERTDLPPASASADVGVIADIVMRLEKQFQQFTVAAFADRRRRDDGEQRRRYDRSVSPPRSPPPPAPSTQDVRDSSRPSARGRFNSSRYQRQQPDEPSRSASRGERGVRFEERTPADQTRRAFGPPPQVCDSCGSDSHPRWRCRYRTVKCFSCNRTGHKSSVCRAAQRGN